MNKPTDDEREIAKELLKKLSTDGMLRQNDPVETVAQALADHRDKHDRETIDVSDQNVFFKMSDGEEVCNEELALAILLNEEILFCNERHTAMKPIKVKDGKFLPPNPNDPWEVTNESTTVLYVNCNDLFYWGTADAESLPNDEIGKLYKMWKKDGAYGVDKWCCLRRGLRPQVPIVERMKKDGFWDDELEALPAPEPS